MSSPATKFDFYKKINKIFLVGDQISLSNQINDNVNAKIETSVIKELPNEFEESKEDECYIIDNIFAENVLNRIPIEPRFSIFSPLYFQQLLLEKKQIPTKTYRVSDIFKGKTLSFTSLPQSSRKLSTVLAYCIGFDVSGNFHEGIHYLIAGEAGSRKFVVASHLNKPIMLIDWLNNIVKDSLSNLNINIKNYEKFFCPIFKGFTITVSGFSLEKRKEIEKMVLELGGTYTKSMNQATCTHLILEQPCGQKYNFAVRWHVHRVNMNWILEAYNKRVAQDEMLYKIDSDENKDGPGKTSTPNSSRIDVSVPEISIMSNMSNISETINCSSTFNIATINSSNHLDGLCIYLEGFEPNILNDLKRLINLSGASRSDDFTENVTHVVLENEKLVKKFKDKEVAVVNSGWLIDCANKKKLLDVSNYNFYKEPQNNNDSINNTLLSEANIQNETLLLRKDKTLRSDINGGDIDNADLLSQYIGDNTLLRGTEKDCDQNDTLPLSNCVTKLKNPLNSVIENIDLTKVEMSRECVNKRTDDSIDITEEQSDEDNNLLFSGYTFFIYPDIDNIDEIKSEISKNGGRIVNEFADFRILPIQGSFDSLKEMENNVTVNWINLCLERELVMNPTFCFRPIPLILNSILQNCFLTFSGFSGVELETLRYISNQVGAVVQDSLFRKDTSKYRATTHVILKNPSGKKYEAAKNWKIWPLNIAWLKTCLSTQQRANEEMFLIDSYSHTNVDYVLDIFVKKTTVIDADKITEECSEFNNISRMTNDLTVNPDKQDDSDSQYVDSPSVFLNPEKPFKPKFILNSQLACTPNERKLIMKDINKTCLKNMEHILKSSKLKASPRGMTPAIKRRKSSPFEGIVICVCDKIADRQTACNDLVKKLGGVYKWKIDDASITHIICDTKMDKDEIEGYKERGCFTVTEDWLIKCVESNKRLSENDFGPKLIRVPSLENQQLENNLKTLMESDKRPKKSIPKLDHNPTQRYELFSQEEEILWNPNANGCISLDRMLEQKRHFIFSGLSGDNKTALNDLVEKLKSDCLKNCEYTLEGSFNENSTHLITGKITRNEKVLSAIVSGNWVLKPDYIRDCFEKKKWLAEESYEWANSLSDFRKNSLEYLLIQSARDWRKKINETKIKPFNGWIVGLFLDKSKLTGFHNILKSGGAEIAWENETNPCKVTHCIVESQEKANMKLLKTVNADNFYAAGYLVAYLTCTDATSYIINV